MAELNLAEGMRVKMFEGEEEIDECIVRRVSKGGNPLTDEIQIESLTLDPGAKEEFAFIPNTDPSKEGWRMLFPDPGGGRAYSQRAPAYTFRPV